jgi:hypothetical protein
VSSECLQRNLFISFDFEYLGLAITIHSKRTLNGLKGLPWFLLETVMVQNSSIYDELEKYMNDNLSPQTHVYDGDTDDGDIAGFSQSPNFMLRILSTGRENTSSLASLPFFSGCKSH